MEKVSWEDIQEFIRRLNATVGEERYRLPTEAEWEYAARAGTRGDRYGNLDAIAWYDGNSGDRTHPVGRKAPNAFGLHDMLGNVEEWVQDWYGDYPGGAVTDPVGPGSGSERVVRGGGWYDIARIFRASYRYYRSPGEFGSFRGLSPAEDRVTLGSLTLLPSAMQRTEGRAGSREGGRISARAEQRTARGSGKSPPRAAVWRRCPRGGGSTAAVRPATGREPAAVRAGSENRWLCQPSSKGLSNDR